MNLPTEFDGMRLKIEGVLMLCIVAVLAKTCLEKFTPTYAARHTIYFRQKLSFVDISRKLLDVLKNIFFDMKFI